MIVEKTSVCLHELSCLNPGNGPFSPCCHLPLPEGKLLKSHQREMGLWQRRRSGRERGLGLAFEKDGDPGEQEGTTLAF